MAELKDQMAELNDAIHDLDIQISKEEEIERIDRLIDDKRAEQRRASQNAANADRILFQIQELNMKKNSMLSDSVNKHFNGVRFVLFRIQKNGEIVPACIPEIMDDEGNWKDYFTTANQSLKLKADIEILNGLQRFYGVSLPIIVDGAEAFDQKHREELQCDCQLITLSVSDDLTLSVNEI